MMARHQRNDGQTAGEGKRSSAPGRWPAGTGALAAKGSDRRTRAHTSPGPIVSTWLLLSGHYSPRQGKARQGKARQGKARQGKASSVAVLSQRGKSLKRLLRRCRQCHTGAWELGKRSHRGRAQANGNAAARHSSGDDDDTEAQDHAAQPDGNAAAHHSGDGSAPQSARQRCGAAGTATHLGRRCVCESTATAAEATLQCWSAPQYGCSNGSGQFSAPQR